MAVIAIHAFVAGRVQGVWFRQSTKEKAVSLALRGWVRNLPDGQVELKAAGEELAVRQLEAWLSQGSELAEVESSQIGCSEPSANDGEFEIH